MPDQDPEKVPDPTGSTTLLLRIVFNEFLARLITRYQIVWLSQVMEQLESVMDFWLKEGVDGFNIDSVNLLVENFAASTGNIEKSMVSLTFWLS